MDESEVKKDKKEKSENKQTKSKKKIVLITIAVIFVLLILGIGIGAYYYIRNEESKISEINSIQEQAFLEFSEEVKYGQEISYEDFLAKLVDTSKLKENTNIRLEINDKELLKGENYKFEQLGTYNVKIKLEYLYNYSIINSITKMIENENTLNIIVGDKQKPVINGVVNKEITVGDEINLSEGITATDDVDGELEVKVEGTVDNTKAGEYKITVTATDKSENTEETTFTVTVKEKPKVETNTTQKNTNNNNSSNTGKTNSNNNSGGTSSGNNGSASSGVSRESHINTILSMTNQYRAEVGAAALTLDSKLSSAAQKRAVELVSKQSHTRPDGRDCFTVFDEFGILSFASGENIAWGQTSGASAATWWRNSPGHYANMIQTMFKKIGIGAYNQGGRWYWVQLFSD